MEFFEKYKIINRRKLLSVIVFDLICSVCFKILFFFRKEKKKKKHSIYENQPKRILVIRLAYIGDLVLTLPIFPRLRKLFPDAEITLLTSSKTAPICYNNPNIDRIITYEPPWFYNHWKFSDLLTYYQFIRELRHQNFDLGIDTRSDLRNIAFILFAAKVKRRIAFEFGGGGYFLTDIVPYDRLKHKVDLHLDLLRYLGDNNGEINFEIFLTKEEKRYAFEFLKSIKTPKRMLVFALHPGARVPLKRWDTEKYAELAEKLLQTYPCSILLLGEESEKQYIDKIKLESLENCYSAVGKFSLRQLISVIEQSSLLICNDSAPMHLGVAVNTPTVTIFGPSKSMETGPYLGGHRIVEKNFMCRYSCDETNCSQPEFIACLKAISVDDVFSAVQKLVGKTKK